MIGMNRRLVAVIAILCCLLVGEFHFPDRVQAVEDKVTGQKEILQKLEKAADALYTSVQNGNMDLAQKEIDQIIHLVQKLPYEGLTSVEGIHTLMENVIEVKEAVSSVKPSPDVLEVSSAKLRLAVDSLVHVKGALWLQYYKVMIGDLEKLEQARVAHNQEALQHEYAELQGHYERIRPAVVIRKETYEVARFDAWISHLGGLVKEPLTGATSQLQGVIQQGSQELSELFGRAKEEAAMLPVTGYSNPWSWTLLIGGWIGVALLYAGFRKYQASEEIKPIRR